jgi:hypothetical protein
MDKNLIMSWYKIADAAQVSPHLLEQTLPALSPSQQNPWKSKEIILN